MGFLSTLGNVGGALIKVSPYIAAPFTAGASLAAVPAANAFGNLAGSIGQVAGAAAGGRAAGRQAESQSLNQRDLAANQLYGTQQNAQMQAGQLDLQRQLAAQNMQSQRAKQGVAGDLISRMQDVNINIPGIQTAQVTGGLRPSALGETGRQSGALLAQQALAKQLEGDKFTGGQILTPPKQSEMPKANALDSILNTVGLGGSMFGAASSGMPGKQPNGEIWGGAPMDEGAVASLPKLGEGLAGLPPEVLQMLMGNVNNPNAEGL